MKRTYGNRANLVSKGSAPRVLPQKQFHAAIHKARNAILIEHASLAGSRGRLLRLALNEAEALAWQTDFPQLVFPVLAEEKVRAAVAWSVRQDRLLRAQPEVAFAE